MYRQYIIWKNYHSSNEWSKTAHVVKARTDTEAERKMRRMFKHHGLSSMSLVALPEGITPKM